jgi:ubiquinone/menaquinone biosynthesis C-methylase UbiE
MVVQTAPFGLLDYYFTSIGVGLKSLLGRHCREAAARIANPLSYPRYMEYQLTVDALGPLRGCRVLDIGSPKLPALLVARDRTCELYATDIRDYFIAPTAEFLTRMGLGDRLGRGVHLEVQDARCLSYEDGTFDRVYSISVLEHIPDTGDSEAIREIARVLKPGGTLTLTVPFSARGYYEEFVEGDVYERNAEQGGTFYQRHYDLDALMERLVQPSGLVLDEMGFFGEPRVRFEPYWNRISMRWKLPLLWAQPFLAKLFLKRLTPDQRDAACGVALRMSRPAMVVR